MKPRLLELRDDVAAAGARGLVDRQQHIGNRVAPDQPRQVARRIDAQAVDRRLPQRFVVVEKADHVDLPADLQGRGDLSARRARAVNEDSRQFTICARHSVAPSQPGARETAQANHQQQQHDRLDEADGARHPDHSDIRVDQRERHRIDRDCLCDRDQRRKSSKAEDRAVKPEQDEDRQREQDRDDCRVEDRPENRRPVVGAQVIGDVNAGRAQQCVCGEGDGALCWARQCQDRFRNRCCYHANAYLDLAICRVRGKSALVLRS